MSRPSYKELQRKVKELEQIVNMKVYPWSLCFETRDLLYFRLAPDWSFDFLDERIVELTEYSRDDFLERKVKWLEIVHENDRAELQNALRSGLESDRYISTEFRILTKQGSIKWVAMRGPLFTGKNGGLIAIQGIMNDITPQKRVEMALESEREIFRWVANSLEDGIYIVSNDHRITFMNNALMDLVGDHVGKVCYEALFQRDTICPWSVMDCLKNMSCGVQEYHLPGLERTFQVRSFPIRGRDGSIGKLGQLKDITKTKRLEHKVKDYAVRHQAIVEAANIAEVGIFILQNHDGVEARFRHANEAFCKIIGYSLEELVNMRIADLLQPGDVESIMERYRQRQRGEQVNHAYELKMVRKNGACITAILSAAVSTYDGATATVGFLRDVTERKKVEKSLWLSQRLASIGRLAAEVAHEMNNPLTSVLTFNKLIGRIVQQQPFPKHRMAELSQYVDYLDAEATRCADIARNLLDFSRQGDVEFRENSINELLEKTIDVLRPRTQMGEIGIETSYDRSAPHIHCDGKRLQQAFVNILWNAVESMPSGGTLSVSTDYEREKNVVTVVIEDTGVGIPEENLGTIFEPFFTTKAEGKGVGLGLSVAYGIIRQHQGQIEVQSEVGKGTRFTVQLRVDICIMPTSQLDGTQGFTHGD